MILTAVGQSCRPFRSGPTHVFLTVWVPGKLLLMSRMRRSGFLIKDRLMLSSISWDGVMLGSPAKYWSIMAVRASVLARASFMSSSLLSVPSRSVTAITTGPRTSFSGSIHIFAGRLIFVFVQPMVECLSLLFGICLEYVPWLSSIR